MEPGTLTKVLHDFLTTVEGELSLHKGEFFLVYNVIDKHWCYGESAGRMGKFPTNYLHKVDIPVVQSSQTLFVTTAPFSKQQSDDLDFLRGEIIVGIKEAGHGWFLGQIDDRRGIFPLTHTWQINMNLLKKSLEKKQVRKKAIVKTSLKAQLEGELDLMEGDIIVVTEILDDGWCHGIKEDGKEGIFPEGFISYMDNDFGETDTCTLNKDAEQHLTTSTTKYTDSAMPPSAEPYTEEPVPNYYDLFPQFSSSMSGYTNNVPHDNNGNSLNVKPYAITLYPFNGQFPNELSFKAGEVVHLIKHIDSEWMEGALEECTGIFPASYVNIIVECCETKCSQSISDQDTATQEYETLVSGTKAKVEYTFKAQMDGDLSVMEGDTVTVVGMANKDWVNVENQFGDIGLCPRGYLSSVSEESVSLSEFIDDFVVIRNEKLTVVDKQEQKSKRLSEPHRPAPPVPAPGRMPLQTEIIKNKEVSLENLPEQMTIASENKIDLKQKRADQRQNVISELVLTEKEYVRDLKLTYEVFNLHESSLLEDRGIDVNTLFGNIYDVIQVAEELLDMILRAMKGCDEELQTIGPCFSKMAEKLQTVYVKYCGNHESALALLKKYESNEDIMAVFDKGISTLRPRIACFDMSSILIKPVQRILKYPLILYELIKCTDDSHPDKPVIEEAWKTMTDVASYINEYKRRKDLVSKYLDNDNTLIRKVAKLNMHSVAKMSTRLSTKLSASLGLTNVSVDPEFEDLERQFRSVEKCIWQLAKDVEQCLTYLNVETFSGEVISDFLTQYYQGTPSVEASRLRDIRSTIWSQYMQELKQCLEKRVSIPINFLISSLEGPAVLITKRYDKLLDYDAAISKSERYKDSKIVQDELATAKCNFEALSQQLLEELPILIAAATKILVNCVSAFAHSRKLMYGKITRRYLTLCETSTQFSPQGVLEVFLVNHNLVWNQITRFTFAGSTLRAEEQSSWSSQNQEQRRLLKNKYPDSRLYTVTENITSSSSLDMSALKGTLIAVIKKQDPMGDTTRWFVENGVNQGFLPSQKLQPLQQTQQVDPTRTTTVTNDSNMPDLISMDSPEKETKNTSHLQELLYLDQDEMFKSNYSISNNEQYSSVQQYENLNYQYYYAMFDFDGTMPGTLPITKGQALRLVRPHDEKGNDAWWLVEDRHGKKGYVPQNYLSTPPQVQH